jgi:hypothetical protein
MGAFQKDPNLLAVSSMFVGNACKMLQQLEETALHVDAP